MNDKKREGPFSLDMDFDEALQRFAQTDPKEITSNASNIKSLASKSGSKEITPQGELDLGIEIERDIGGIGMGVLGDGTPYLNQLSRNCSPGDDGSNVVGNAKPDRHRAF